MSNATPDAGHGPGDAQTCFGTMITPICLAALPTQPITFDTQMTIDTGDPKSGCVQTTDSSASSYCVIAGTEISVNAAVRAIGTRPLVLIATHTLTVGPKGAIDAGSRRNPALPPADTASYGAGANPSTCQAGDTPGLNGGGAGGSFIGLGGTGGAGLASNAAGGHPGVAATLGVNQLVRGGCPGQTPGTTTPIYGSGGGAVYLIAGQSITVGGTVLAGGAGAKSGVARTGMTGGGGGGGGGSGGMIGLDAPSVSVSGVLVAGGGGGGSGGNVGPGHSGCDAVSATEPADGGGGNTASGGNAGAGNGGTGSSPASAAGAPGGAATIPPGSTDQLGGGGGGGGGAGVILVPAAATGDLDSAQISPPVTRK